MKYTRPTYANEEIEVVDVINASIVKVVTGEKEIPVTDTEGNVIGTETVPATMVSVDISNLF